MTELEQALLLQVEALTQEREVLLKKCQQAQDAYAQIMDQLKQMLRHRYGQKSERYVDPNDPQLSLLEELVTAKESEASVEALVEEETSDENVVSINAHRRRKKAQKQFAENLPRKEIVIPVDSHDKSCLCGCQKKVIKHERHERLHYEPPVYEVLVELREVVACPKGCEAQIVTAPKPKHILPKAKVSESVMAHVIVSKLDDRQPYYHLEKQFQQRAGFSWTRQSMARNTIDCAVQIQPLFNLMKDQIIGYDIGALDATSFQVLREPGRSATTKSYAYCFRGGPPEKKVVLYEYNALAHKGFVNDWFAGFTGTLHCDADPFFELLFQAKSVNPSYCNAHARRKFEVVAKAAQKEGLAHEAMRFYKRVYLVEREAKIKSFTPKQRQELREEKTKPLMETFKDWLD